ncbi:MAG: hypothetical protein IKA64_06530 [Clostridia bacterium]|nr:hypothetical protein [Clostridia bacterium]
MKKIIKCALFLALILGALASMLSCSSDDGVPEGMQLLRAEEGEGYCIYAPKEWRVANQGDIACAYVSTVDNSSISFTRGEKPESLSDYFRAEAAKLPFEITLSVEGEAINFGNATAAYRYVYDYTYKDYGFRTMQVFVYNGDDFYIFTFNSYARERTEGESYFGFYMEKVNAVMESFRFTEKKDDWRTPAEYESDGDGYLLISDKAIAGFKLFVPESFVPDYSSGIVSATHADGTNINMSKATYTGVTYEDYFADRKADLEALSGGEVTLITEGELISVSGATWARAYEYTYTLFGKEYHVYQAMIVKGYNGYVFTYSASGELYAEHLDEAMRAIEKIRFD